MDIGTVIGLIVGIGAILMSIILGGGNPATLINFPSIAVVVGGTIGAIVVSYPLARVFKMHKVLLKAFFVKPADPGETIRDLVRYAEVARREGILSLENLISEMKDPFIVRGVKMAVDGTDPELIKTIMDTELEALMERHFQGKQMLDLIGRYAPAFGMIGTLLGLIAMLQNMDDPSKIGPGMAVALITTLYGALLANIVTGPMGDKLVSRDNEEVLVKSIIIAGVMSIQSGDNPRVVESKLLTFLPPADRAAVSPGEAA
ncbi:MAG: motility protein A [Phycisphaerales bacterium]|nr:MAG: motility protein A [Phycisphaerales bacterium]